MKNRLEQLREEGFRFVENGYANKRYADALDQLSEANFSFTFRDYYNKGYFSEQMQFNSLMYGDEVVSHISVSQQPILYRGKSLNSVQLGTVMTAASFRKRGLSGLLMDKVLEEWDSKSDFIFLYANDSVLDYYPKFGFKPVKEYKMVSDSYLFRNAEERSYSSLDFKNKTDIELFDRVVSNAAPIYNLSFTNNRNLSFFYCDCFQAFNEHMFYFREYDAIVIAYQKENTLTLLEVITTRKDVPYPAIINSLANESTERVELIFVVSDWTEFDVVEHKEDDSTLMVRKKGESIFETDRLCISTLSHT